MQTHLIIREPAVSRPLYFREFVASPSRRLLVPQWRQHLFKLNKVPIFIKLKVWLEKHAFLQAKSSKLTDNILVLRGLMIVKSHDSILAHNVLRWKIKAQARKLRDPRQAIDWRCGPQTAEMGGIIDRSEVREVDIQTWKASLW
jgi:hypothetical protein